MTAVGREEMEDWVDERYPDDEEHDLALNKILGLQDDVPSRPGNIIKSDNFKITLGNVMFENGEHVMFENNKAFDFSLLLAAILEATIDYKHLSELEQLINTGIRNWLSTTRQGAQYLSYLMISESNEHFYAALLYTSAHWQEDAMGPWTPLAVYDHVKASCNIDISALDVGVRISEMGSWGGRRGEERKKGLEVMFRPEEEVIQDSESGEIIETVDSMKINFVLEKKRVNKSLKDLAAEAVARQLEDEGGIKQLQIPGTLRKNISDKFKDKEWVMGHWRYIMEDKRRQLAIAKMAGAKSQESGARRGTKRKHEQEEREEKRIKPADTVHPSVLAQCIQERMKQPVQKISDKMPAEAPRPVPQKPAKSPSFSDSQKLQLKSQILAYRLLARGQTVLDVIKLAAVTRSLRSLLLPKEEMERLSTAFNKEYSTVE